MKRTTTIINCLLAFSLYSTGIYAQLNFVNRAGSAGINHSYPVNMGGGGISFVDFDGDGWDDLTLGTGPEESIQFYHNQSGSFEKIELINTDFMVKSVLWVDYNNDGLKDLFVAGYDSHNRLFKNNGDLDLEDVTESAGLSLSPKRCFGASFSDVNRDGWLDLYYAERRFPGESVDNQMRLFINNTDGTFSDQTAAYGVADAGRTPFCSTFFDCNNDKWPDVYIANDKETVNTFLENTGAGFEDRSEASGGDLAMNAMCVAMSDFDKNGFTDLFVTNTEEGAALLVNENGQSFAEQSEAYAVTFADGIGWGANFFDADNDGWEDLYVSGMIEGADALSSEFYKNINGNSFEAGNAGFKGDTVISFNNAMGDYDNDGYTDIAVINWTPYKAQLWTLQGAMPNNNWVKVDLEGVYSNRDGIGASICVYTPAGEPSCRYTTSGIGFLGQHSEQIIFGIGQNQSIDSIRVIWPTGHIDLLSGPEINTLHNIIEGSTTGNLISVDDDIEIITSLPFQANVEFLNIDFFPNPASTYLHLKNEDARFEGSLYEIISTNGRIAMNGYVEDSAIDINTLPKGLYFITLTTDKQQSLIGEFVKH